jgi:CARDB protein
MLPFLLSAALAATPPSPCPIDIVVANPRLKVVRVRNRGYENNIVTVSVTNNGNLPQRAEVRQHLDLLFGSTVIGSQPIPALGAQQSYEAAFRFQDKYEKKRQPRAVTLRFVIDSKAMPGENCTTSNDQVTTTL